MNPSYEIRAIAPEVLAQLRERDDAGHPPRPVRDGGGSPLRCCLGRSRPGDRVALLSYAPLRRWAADTGADPGPYDEVGPVFVHADGCGGPADAGFPEGMRGRLRMLRAYGADGRILRGHLVTADAEDADDDRVERGLDDLFADPVVAVVHLRTVEFGCFLMEARRT